MAKFFLVSILVLLAAGATWFYTCCKGGPKSPPQFDLDAWWGDRQMISRQDKSIRPFKVEFSSEMITDLKSRLKNHHKWVPPLEGVGFQYGFNSEVLNDWLDFWANKYPFENRAKFLNQFPQFKTNIQGLDIHFIRVKPEVPPNVAVLPLLLMHGWPGSVREFYEAIPLLTKPYTGYDFAFEVIVPSLPGYGFSSAAVRPGLGVPEVAVVMRNLMNRLGFKKYYIQGGDWGAVIAKSMATYFPDEILGHHNNMLTVMTSCTQLMTFIGNYFPSLVVEPHLANKMYPLSNFFSYLMEEFGYMHLQATKPDTIGVALSDSPSGLLAYILEKFGTWTKLENRNLKDGGIESRFTKEQLLDNLMIYWSTNSITTSMRLYAESLNKRTSSLNLDSYKTPVPTWALQAKYELFYQPAGLLKTKYTNLLNTTVLDDGGHFLAFELPKLFTEDVFRAVKAFREFHLNKVKTEL